MSGDVTTSPRVTRASHVAGRLAALCAVLALLATACGNPLRGGAEGGPAGEIVIGASDVGESLLLAEIYAGALRHAGATDVTVRPPVGGREVLVQALQDQSLTLAPDYSGNLLRYFDPGTGATTPSEVYTQLRTVLPDGLEVLDQAPAENTDMLVVRRELAEQGVRTISDLAPHCRDLVFGGPGQWADRWKERIRELYGCEFAEIRTTDTGGPVTVEALRSGEVQVADLFSTSSTIRSNGFVALEDDRNMFPAQNIVPLVATGALSPAETRALDAVSAALTTEKLTELGVEFTERKRNPADIADDFLRDNGLA
ncbi:ABC transporter substrate-binding protein [Prauserella oleivorans]|uniref:ABC transporter substrate-binding protein n=1 Tax=Prauserella oleivorans TaxID=1478153 RepID=A0ABW5WEQ7_9PSEU